MDDDWRRGATIGGEDGDRGERVSESKLKKKEKKKLSQHSDLE